MKKTFSLIMAAALAFASCTLTETTYSVTNVTNYLNYKDGALYNDVGLEFHVTQDLTDGNWKTEGNRFMGTFDILNINYDINLSKYITAIVQDAEEMPDVEDEMHGDPVSILDCSLSGIYLNLYVGFYAKKGTECPHDMHLYYDDDNSTLSLVLIHNGNNELPENKDDDSFTSYSRLYCFPIHDLVMPGEQRSVMLSIDALGQTSDGTFTSQPYTSPVYGGLITF